MGSYIFILVAVLLQPIVIVKNSVHPIRRYHVLVLVLAKFSRQCSNFW